MPSFNWTTTGAVMTLALFLSSANSAPALDARESSDCKVRQASSTTNFNTMSCKAGQQAASTYTGSPGANCPSVQWPSDKYVAAYYWPEGHGQTQHCGKKVKVTSKSTQDPRTIEVVVVDACPTCSGYNGPKNRNGATIDLSPEAFVDLFGTATADGVFDVSYEEI